MIPAEFDYYAPQSLDEAIQLLGEHAEDGKVLAGGHSLIPMMKLRLATPSALIDIGRIPELRGINRSNGTVTIGATTTHRMIEFSEELSGALPIMPQAAKVIGDPMVRNRGTFGGSLAHADPAGDWPAVALALGATMHVRGPDGERTIPAEEFFVDLLTTALAREELLTQIDLPVPSGKVGMSYQKFRHPASGYAVVGVAAVVTLDEAGRCADCRIGITGAGPVARRATEVEDALRGQQLNESTVRDASELAGGDMDFLGDIFASEEYRAQLVKVYTRRAIMDALARLP